MENGSIIVGEKKACCGGAETHEMKSRSRSANEKNMSVEEQERAIEIIFKILKDKKGRVPVNKLFSVIEEAGVGLNDPRLKEIMENITELQRKSMKTEELAKDSYFLDKETFKKIVSHNCVMLHRIMTNDFVIQQFKNFWDEILNIYEDCKSFDEGDPADYIPQLARANRSHWGVSVCTVDGQRANIGDTSIPFCIQSASKPLNYALAITLLGAKTVHEYIGYEPSGISFNSIALNKENKPHNPMINSGAIVTCSLLHTDLKLADRFDNVINEYKKMAGLEFIGFSNPTFLSERETADRNFCLGYYMKENGCFPAGTNVLEVLDFYFQLCSVEITCESGAVIAATLANGGICPLTGERVLSTEAVQDTLSLMHSCGMYDYSGQFAFKVGLPAKSGVSGVILLVVPNLIGIAMWSPPLDKLGNSCRGIKFCKELVHKFAFHNYDSLLHSTAKLDPRRTTQESRSQEIVSLLFSAQNNDVTALRRVCMAGVDMNQTDYDGRSALHIAAAEGHCDVVSFLLEFGQADYSIKDRWGVTPYQEALRFNHTDVVSVFQQHMDECEIEEMANSLQAVELAPGLKPSPTQQQQPLPGSRAAAKSGAAAAARAENGPPPVDMKPVKE
ncbi:hypothetical protein BOX15_Mlig000563g4 [Macrostomum lignano]|uniref:glutaminase n=2 Tax=Macrostomum lignano TaxID=282301 RepID=A0A267DPD6_9PLAT|nr:hypothetical protein BOX15_Mlig000563g4 [Macrostomum lignano]